MATTQPRGRVAVRSSLPVGLEAHRAGSRPRRRQVLRRLAPPAPDRTRATSCRNRSCRATPSSSTRKSTRKGYRQAPRGAQPHRQQRQAAPCTAEDQIDNAEADIVAQATGENADGLLERYPKARPATSTARARSPRWMRSSPISRCSARWSTPRPSKPTCRGDGHEHYDTLRELRGQLGPSRHVRCSSSAASSSSSGRAPRPTTTKRRKSPSRTVPRTETMATKIEKDEITGTATTGHEWDGIKELNTPLPNWWLYTFYAMHHLGARLHRRSIRPGRCSTAPRRASSATPRAPTLRESIDAGEGRPEGERSTRSPR